MAIPNGFSMLPRRTETDHEGRYRFSDLPAGRAVVLAPSFSSTHRQVCGAAGVVGPETQLDLDVEITAIANPQPSLTLPKLKVTGQVYENTPEGRTGVAGAVISLEWLPDAPFLYVFTDANGHYTACGIPPEWPIAFWPLVWHQGYYDPYEWHRFSTDTTLDIELKRR
jgi:hypothetical protein